jgi:peptidoglycan hydrolase CwlO-like protein
MGEAIIVEILLAILSVAIGVGSFMGANRANKQPSIIQSQNEIDDIAAERAVKIYESTIGTLEHHVERLQKQMDLNEQEIVKLHNNNQKLSKDITDCKLYGARLEARLAQYEKGSNE